MAISSDHGDDVPATRSLLDLLDGTLADNQRPANARELLDSVSVVLSTLMRGIGVTTPITSGVNADGYRVGRSIDQEWRLRNLQDGLPSRQPA